MLKKLTSLLIIFQMSSLLAAPIFDLKRSDKTIIRDYLKIHRKFFKRMCTAGEDSLYYKLYREFRGEGYYIPVINETVLDVETIVHQLPYMKSKIKWIKAEKAALKEKKSFKKITKIITEISFLKKQALKFKKLYNHASSKAKKDFARFSSSEVMSKLNRSYKKLMNEIPFLLSYTHPVDHLSLRRRYDEFKGSEIAKKKKIANSVYFTRKIVQDGAQDPNRTRNDRFLRALIDSTTLALEHETEILSENLRVDLEDVLEGVEKQIARGKKALLLRLDEWLKRTQATSDFYDQIVDKRENYQAKTKERLLRKSKTRFSLKDYTLKKHASVYKFWIDQPELMRALFAIETILFNEVGSVDGAQGLERSDVVQVVLNRRMIPYFSKLPEKNSIFPYVEKLGDKVIQNSHWLNVLFKEGEFSFTYYFITGSVKVYCPDMTRRGRHLRKQNLKIALRKIRNPNWSFKAIRYFSRASMLGRVDMTILWDDFEPIAERVGGKTSREKRVIRAIKRKNYDYLYSFNDLKGVSYDVIRVKGNRYAVKDLTTRPKVFFYRNPHLFKYFQSEKTL